MSYDSNEIQLARRMLENSGYRVIKLDEMAMSQSNAMERCNSLGKQFITHFHKIWIAGRDDRDFNHHCHEMQNWYDQVKMIKLKSTNRGLTRINLIDWFFTVGANTEDYLESDLEIDTYERLIIKLLSDDSKIVDNLSDMLP